MPGPSADSPATRINARTLIANSKIGDLADRPMLNDAVYELIVQTTDPAALSRIRGWTMAELKTFLLTQPEDQIRAVMPGLPSDIIGIVVKLMDNAELTKVGQTVFNPLPGSKVGAKGYMGARIQPNSPTDHPEDVVWQVFDAFAYATGDIVVGTNPVDSTVASVAAVENALKDVIDSFGLRDTIPWCVLSHIDVQAEVAERHPGTVVLAKVSIRLFWGKFGRAG